MIKKLVLVAVLLVMNVVSSYADAKKPFYMPTVIPSKEEVLRVKSDDVIIGCDEAKHVMIEYSSLSCPHCASYYKEIFPKVKSEIINKCKAKYIYRDFPTTRSALKGAVVARCLSLDDKGKVQADTFLQFLQMLFQSQSSWAFSNAYEEHLRKMFGVIGVSQDRVSKCMQNDDLMHDIVSKSFTSMKALNMSYAPYIFIDGVEISPVTFDAINAALQ